MQFNTFYEFSESDKNWEKHSQQIKEIFSEKDFQKIFSEVQKILPEEKKFSDIKSEFFDEKEINLFFVSDDEIKNLNNEFRDKDSATDCLSFEKDDEDKKSRFDPVFWECFVAMPYIQKQAEEYWVSLRYEITKMIIHSILHLYWFDHIEDSDFEKMNSLEKIAIWLLKKEEFC